MTCRGICSMHAPFSRVEPLRLDGHPAEAPEIDSTAGGQGGAVHEDVYTTSRLIPAQKPHTKPDSACSSS